MALQFEEMINILGLTVTGDLGPLTIYTKQNGTKVWFPKAPPGKPPSGSQLVIRNRWRQAAAAWKRLSATDRKTWQQIVELAGIRITGYNVFISLFVHPDPEAKATIEHQTNMVFPT